MHFLMKNCTKKNPIVESRSAPYTIAQSFTPILGVKSYSKQMLGAIDEVHGVPDITPLVIRKATLERGIEGEFDSFKREVRVSRDALHPLTTGFHEVGHALDFLFLNVASGYLPRQGWASEIALKGGKGLLAEWVNLTYASRPVSELYLAQASLDKVSEDYELTLYYFDIREIWARSYEQFIGQNCNDRDARIEFSAKRRKTVRLGSRALRVYWTYKEFAPIEKEIRAIFRALGWL